MSGGQFLLQPNHFYIEFAHLLTEGIAFSGLRTAFVQGQALANPDAVPYAKPSDGSCTVSRGESAVPPSLAMCSALPPRGFEIDTARRTVAASAWLRPPGPVWASRDSRRPGGLIDTLLTPLGRSTPSPSMLSNLYVLIDSHLHRPTLIERGTVTK